MSYKRKQEDKRRLKRLYDESKNHYASGAYFDKRKGRVIRFSMSDNGNGNMSRTKFLKKMSNRKIRRSEDILSRGGYKKLFDYWWILF